MSSEEMSIGICGLDCEECLVYIATKEGNERLKQRLAVEYSAPGFEFKAEDMSCQGCGSDMVSLKMCGSCEIRTCALEKGYSTCAECFGFPCEIYDKYVPQDADHRYKLYFLSG